MGRSSTARSARARPADVAGGVIRYFPHQQRAGRVGGQLAGQAGSYAVAAVLDPHPSSGHCLFHLSSPSHRWSYEAITVVGVSCFAHPCRRPGQPRSYPSRRTGEGLAWVSRLGGWGGAACDDWLTASETLRLHALACGDAGDPFARPKAPGIGSPETGYGSGTSGRSLRSRRRSFESASLTSPVTDLPEQGNNHGACPADLRPALNAG